MEHRLREQSVLLSRATCLRERDVMANNLKEVHSKLVKGLLDLIVLQLLAASPIHGYKIITRLRRNFGVYFGPSTIYPLLINLEKKGHVESEWDMNNERPRKIYKLTNEGQSLLNFTEGSFVLLCRKMSSTGIPKMVLTKDVAKSAKRAPMLCLPNQL
jgi:PadR family transcriptional regulator PadR